MATSTQLVDLELNEISGVDHPANLHEGWVVMKNSDDPLDKAVADAIEANDPDVNKGEQTVDLTHDETPVAEVEKDAAPVIDEAFRKEVTDLRKALDEARAEADQVKAERDIEKAVQRAHDWAIVPGVNPTEFGPVLRALRTVAPEETEQIEAILDASATALSEAGVMKELGTDAAPETQTPMEEINSIAKSIVDEGRATNIETAIGIAASENPEVYERYVNEIGA